VIRMTLAVQGTSPSDHAVTSGNYSASLIVTVSLVRSLSMEAADDVLEIKSPRQHDGPEPSDFCVNTLAPWL